MNSSVGSGAGHIAVMAGFALSCFGLLLFLWLAFGGAIPLAAKGYRFQVAFPEATQLAEQADVRISGVNVGKVVRKDIDKKASRTIATVELDRKFAPVHEDARAMLRQKTLLGETYIEMTPGTDGTPVVPEDGRLDNGQVAATVEFDEFLEILPPGTRKAFRRWQANAAGVIENRDRDFNDALGNLAGFARDGSNLLQVLNRRRDALKGLVRETGTTFEAFTQDEDALRAFMADTSKWFQATASEKEQLAEAIRIFPTFLDESKATLERLETFAVDTKPLVDDLRPVARDLQPTLRDLGTMAPSLQALFGDLPALIRASERGLPALSAVLRGLEPALEATGPFLAQLNPLLEFLGLYNGKVSDFLNIGPSALAGRRATINPNSGGHVLPQLIVTGSQSFITPQRTRDNRGNTYLKPEGLTDPRYKEGFFVFPNWDCNHVGEKKADDTPGCYVQEAIPFQGRNERFPRILEDMPGGGG